MFIPRFLNNFEEIMKTRLFWLLVLNFSEAMINSGFALVNYHLVEISSS